MELDDYPTYVIVYKVREKEDYLLDTPLFDLTGSELQYDAEPKDNLMVQKTNNTGRPEKCQDSLRQVVVKISDLF